MRYKTAGKLADSSGVPIKIEKIMDSKRKITEAYKRICGPNPYARKKKH